MLPLACRGGSGAPVRAREGRIAVEVGTLLCALAVGCGAPFEADEQGDAAVESMATGDASSDATLDGGPGADGDTGATVAVRDWAQWPMPNSALDIATGAPNPESYVDNGDGTATDGVTGLMWQQTSASADGFPTLPWSIDGGSSGATAFCTDLSFAGHQDWRLPTVIELVSIVDNSVAEPSIDPTFFPNTPIDIFWSSTTAPGLPGRAWAVAFDYGYTGYGDEAASGLVRCVRGGADALPGRYTFPAPGTVYDTRTKLTWQQPVLASSAYPWGDASTPGTAQSYCAAASTAGLTGWRLPTVGELQTLVDYSRTGGLQTDGGPRLTIDERFFSDTPPGVFWSSTPIAGNPGFAWGVNFTFGNANGYNVQPSNYVRCVR